MSKPIPAGGVSTPSVSGTVACEADSPRPMGTYSGEPELSGAEIDENSDPEALFQLWYRGPLTKLDRDAGFIILGTSCWLYERFVTALREVDAPSEKQKSFFDKCLAEDFDIAEPLARTFWDVIRNGLLHQGMPKTRKHRKALPQWELGEFAVPIALNSVTGRLEVDPLRVRAVVLALYSLRPELIVVNRRFLWGRIYRRAIKLKTQAP